MAQLVAGNRAPAFTLTDQHGKKVKLSDFKGKLAGVYYKVSPEDTVPKVTKVLEELG